LPARLDDVLSSNGSGWLRVPVGVDGTVFARPTNDTPARAIEVLRAMAPSLVAAVAGPTPPRAPETTVEPDPLQAAFDADTVPRLPLEGTGAPGLAGVLGTL